MTEAVLETAYGAQAAPTVPCARSAERDEAFSRFYALWQPRLLGYARRNFGSRDADEITQETFARAYESLDFTRDSRRQWAWLTVVARNIAADLGRHRRLCDVPVEEFALAPAPGGDGVEQPLLDEECLRVLRDALSELPHSQSRAWWLTIAEGMTPQSIATSLACSPVSVRQALFKSRRRLAFALADYCDRVRALALPGLLVLRRLAGHARRHAGRTAANAGVSATLASSAIVGVLAVIGGTVPMPATSPLTTAAAVVRPAHVSRELPARAAHSYAARPHRSPSSTTSKLPAKTSLYVSAKPLASGTTADGVVTIQTPAGNIRTGAKLWRTAGNGILCGRTNSVSCG